MNILYLFDQNMYHFVDTKMTDVSITTEIINCASLRILNFWEAQNKEQFANILYSKRVITIWARRVARIRTIPDKGFLMTKILRMC